MFTGRNVKAQRLPRKNCVSNLTVYLLCVYCFVRIVSLFRYLKYFTRCILVFFATRRHGGHGLSSFFRIEQRRTVTNIATQCYVLSHIRYLLQIQYRKRSSSIKWHPFEKFGYYLTHHRGTLLLFRQTLSVPSAPGVWRHLAEHRPNRNINSKPTRHVGVNAHRRRLLNFLPDSRDEHIVWGFVASPKQHAILYIILLLLLLLRPRTTPRRTRNIVVMWIFAFVCGGFFFRFRFSTAADVLVAWRRVFSQLSWHGFPPMNFVGTISAFEPHPQPMYEVYRTFGCKSTEIIRVWLSKYSTA